jgi:hypothetical protein
VKPKVASKDKNLRTQMNRKLKNISNADKNKKNITVETLFES